ncbi:hypothetical protein EPO04_03395 [Patescibacteria group bacterium]|nr:MAG: hypothetical protein EPO04_03395 [Patescibacteria group bacterium]
MIDSRAIKIGLGGALAVIVLSFVVSFGFYSNRILPGVKVNGVNVGGLTKPAAQKLLEQELAQYQTKELLVQYNKTTLRIPISALKPQLAGNAAEFAYSYGRTGSPGEQFHARARSLVNRPTMVTAYSYDSSALTPFALQVDEDVNKPVANAALSFDGGQVVVSPSQPGRRLDIGLLAREVGQYLGRSQDGLLTAPTYLVEATIDEDTLAAAQQQATKLTSAPLTVTAGSTSRTVDQSTILGWLSVTAQSYATDMATGNLMGFYRLPTEEVADSHLDPGRVESFAQSLAKSVNTEPQDAGLTIQDGKVVVASPSRDGLQLDVAKATQQIITALNQGTTGQTLALATKVAKPAVYEGNLDQLGIKELIGEGVSYFPGSSRDRITNVAVGTRRYQNVLIKPGQTFSFGAQLGDVGPAQGYKPSLVIIGTKEEKQYGGGLCQVSSTLYRAALTAGLPIVQRTNHAFAINEFYTQPYGVPGVDATVYYPAVDLKFKNDTPGYILIQTNMQGTTLKFDLYGTKVKSGRIRGPEFISGSMDATQPSHTVFYRDVLDLNGNVTKTDTVHTYYKSSKDFTVVESKQFN